MRKTMISLFCLLFVLVVTGCESMGEKTKTGAVAGGLIGAAAGGIIGHQSGHGLEGAAIGAGVGALSGGLIGSAMDKKAKETNPNHLTLSSIMDMSSKGMPDGAIIDEIKRTKSVYTLDSETIAYLKQNKVSDKVIDAMLATGKK